MDLARRTNGIDHILCPASVAVVGASRKLNSIGGSILSNLLQDGFTGRIYPINPTAEEVQGLKAYPSVTAVGESVDLAVIAVPVKAVEQVVDDCVRARVKGLVIITAGFAESSAEGRALERRILEKVRAAGIRMVGPNCMGVLNTDRKYRLNATFTPIYPPEGNIAILSQSGALGLTILDHVKALNLGISSFVSVGNKADVSGNDLLIYWASDPNTDVILLYLESFGNPRKFARIAPEVVRQKPVIAVKAGRSAAGSRAASSHSAAMASLDVAVGALFEQAGVIRTETLEDMFDLAALLATQPVPEGPCVGVVTNAGGPGILLADACEARGLSLPQLAPDTVDALRAFLPPHAGMANPIDLVGSDDPALIERAMTLVGNDPNIDAVVVIFIPPLLTTRPEDVAAGIGRGAAAIPRYKPVQGVFMSALSKPELLSTGERGRIPSYAFPENAAMALAAAYQYGQWRKRPVGRACTLDPMVTATIRQIIDAEVENATKPFWLPATDVGVILDTVGISYARSIEVAIDEVSSASEQVGFPVVLKAIAPGLVHKSDVGGVVLGLETPQEVRDAAIRMREQLAKIGIQLEKVLVQREVRNGIEMMIGLTTDPVFGPLLVCGMGGVHVELIKDVAFRLTPVHDRDAEEMIAQLKSAPLLRGYRGGPPGDRHALIQTILRISALAEAVPELLELDLNPVKVLPPGQGLVAVDARMRICPPGAVEARRTR